jgi:hypothetical protein
MKPTNLEFLLYYLLLLRSLIMFRPFVSHTIHLRIRSPFDTRPS